MSHGEQRFSIIPAAAVTDERLDPRDLQVLCLFGRHTDKNGWCCRSQVKMARELRCGRATVQRAIMRLVDAGYVEHRANYRDSGGDAAHDYRVMLDGKGGKSATTGEIPQFEGVPTDGQGCPLVGRGAHLDGQGVPTHERAPMLTTPVKRSEKEGAREELEFERARRAWPSGAVDSRDDAQAAWHGLTADDQRAAVDEIPRFVNLNKSVGRSMICSLAAYLREQRWKALPERAKPAARSTDVPVAVPAPKPSPTRFQLANRHLFPEIFGSTDGGGSEVGEAQGAGPVGAFAPKNAELNTKSHQRGVEA